MAAGALELLISGATSLAAASNWKLASDGTTTGTGFDNEAVLKAAAGGANVTGDLTYSLTEGINSFDIEPTFGRYSIGGTSSGSLKVQLRDGSYSAATQVPRIRNSGNGTTLYFDGDDSAAQGFFINTGSATSYLSGSWTLGELHVDGGTVEIGQNVINLTAYDWYITGGNVVIAASATKFVAGGNLYISGGTTMLRRGHSGKIFVSGGTLIIDASPSTTQTFAEIEVSGSGRLILYNSGTITLYRAIGGTNDLAHAGREITITTFKHAFAANVQVGPSVTLATKVKIGMGAVGL